MHSHIKLFKVNINPFLANVPILYLLKTSVVFREYKKGLLTWNRLKPVTQPAQELQLPYYYFWPAECNEIKQSRYDFVNITGISYVKYKLRLF